MAEMLKECFFHREHHRKIGFHKQLRFLFSFGIFKNHNNSK
jgi:hypothetical protein